MSTVRKISKQTFYHAAICRWWRQIFNLLIICCCSITKIYAQYDLRADSIFFHQQVKEFGNWLNKTNIRSIAKIDHLEINSNNLSLILVSNYKTDDSLKVAWRTLQKQFDNTQIEQISEKIFNTFTFLCAIGPDSVSIYIKGKEFKDDGIKIYYKDYVRTDENFPNTLASGILELKLKDISLEHGKKLSSVKSGTSVSQVRRSINDFIKDYYSHKNGGWYRVNVDTTRNFFNKSTYIITCIKNEIISDGYFEFIQIQVQVYLKGDSIQISYDILGKYATGILCPNQRDKFYKSMETYYQGKVEQYAEEMKERINTHLRGNFSY
jgi:hypothetical protein